nr:HNH endonuclease signature motif containing protein [Allokutzneria albata]
MAQRKALAVRDKGCAFPGCDRPPGWTEAHHVWHWIDGGPTDLGNLVLLCVHHHHVMHEQEWRIVFEQGIPSFIPPRWIDVEQKPLRNIRVDYPLAL